MKAVGKAIVLRTEKEVTQKTSGGLILNEKNREDIRYRDAVVVSVGSLVPVDSIKEGDRVKYDRHSGHVAEINGEFLTVVSIDNIVIVL
jgi:co-chaperonin GroES (HSP10)